MGIQLNITQEVEKARKIWKWFVKNEQLFDVWEYRYCFFTPEKEKIFFIYATKDENVIFLAPFITTLEGKIEFFWKHSYKNTFYCAQWYEFVLKIILDKIKHLVSLWDILLKQENSWAFLGLSVLEKMDTLFYMHIQDVLFEKKLIEKMERRHRKRLERQLQILSSSCTLDVSNNPDFAEVIGKFNISLFWKKSAFLNASVQKSIENLAITPDIKSQFLNLYKEEKCICSAFIIEYGNTLYAEHIWYTPLLPSICMFMAKSAYEYWKKNGLQHFCFWAGGEFWWKKTLSDYAEDMYRVSF